ncbi:MAG: hypothetical protein ABI759_27505 [Candidatus Solibacter sp.]
MPASLRVQRDTPTVLAGDALLSGFGSDLNLTPAGPPFMDGDQISFGMTVAEPQWSVAGNRSRVAQFQGASEPDRARWAIPISKTPPERLGEAAHGGSLVLSFSQGLTSTLAAQQGNPFNWFVTTLTANADRVELESLQPNSGARYDLELWQTSVSELRFAEKPITLLNFRSERGGLDTAAVVGGSCVNKWDLPRQADGPPFAYATPIDVFGFISTSSTFLVHVRASAPAPALTQLAGFALENLYLLVRSPRRLALLAMFDTAPALPSGKAVMYFDVSSAIPTLPDPYAANLETPEFDGVVERALRVDLPWADANSPALSAHLERRVTFPEPRFQRLDDPDEGIVYEAFRGHLKSNNEFLYLLDLSSREHLFGVALESPSDNDPKIIDNRLSLGLNKTRLLMQPQVLWEPVRVVANPNQNIVVNVDGVAASQSNGGPTLIGANDVKLVPILPAALSDEILAAIRSEHPAAALFSLPFGLRAMARLNQRKINIPEDDGSFRTFTLFNEPAFGEFTSARQVRLFGAGGKLGTNFPSSAMPGMMRQLANLAQNPTALTSVMGDLRDALNDAFRTLVPLQYVDLSGYGLSTFSEWLDPREEASFSKVEFRVLNGRTAYEVIQFRSILYECGARTVRTIILERHNSGKVFRMDTGWVAIEPGLFTRPQAFEKGAVIAFRNIRRIRIVGEIFPLDNVAAMQPVLFDADVEIDGALGGLVPIYDRPGYIQILPVTPPPGAPPNPPKLNATQLKRLFDRVKAITSPVDCAVRIGNTLEAQITSIASDVALDEALTIGFAVAVVGTPKLPNAGQWSVVRLDRASDEVTPVDRTRGVPIVRNGAGPYRFREPSDTRQKRPRLECALLMATETSRALFAVPKIDPGQPGRISFDFSPVLADPYSLVQSSGLFPRPNLGLRMNEVAGFQITPQNLWRIDNETFTVAAKPLTDLMEGAGWGINRDYEAGPVKINIDSASQAAFHVESPVSVLNLDLPDLGNIFQIKSTYQTVAGGLPKLLEPKLLFLGALEELKKTLDSLANLANLPFNFDVSVTAGSGATPSFVVHMHLLFRVGSGPDGRIDIGMGKFFGQFLVRGELEAALTGVERARLLLEFQGDVQQGILPPLLYAGGFFRFSIELRETGGPIIQLALGVVTSIGGNLIPGLLEVEVTIKYGYTLIPETLDPGVLLGLEARAKLLAGLIGFSFSVEAMASLHRDSPTIVTVSAQIRVAATVQVAIFFEEEVDFETQFKQEIPLLAVGLIPGVGLAVLPAALPV